MYICVRVEHIKTVTVFSRELNNNKQMVHTKNNPFGNPIFDISKMSGKGKLVFKGDKP